jgi:hypothetical protein
MNLRIRARLQNHHFGPLSVLIIPIIIWMLPVMMSGTRGFLGDIAFYFYPMIKTGMDQWRHGMVPLWTNLIQCGFPLLADGQAALCYPLHVLPYLVLPPVAAEHCSIAFQVVLTAVLMYAFVISLGLGRWPAVMGGWIWTFSGPIAASMYMGTPALNGMTWWPLWFILAGRIASKFDWCDIAITGLIMGLGWLGGFPQTAFYGIFASSVWLLFLLISGNGSNWRASVPALAGWALAGILGIGVAALQVLPTLEMSGLSIRSGGVDYAFASLGSVPPSSLVSLLIPEWNRYLCLYGLSGIDIFMGFIPLSLALLCIGKHMSRRTMFYCGLLAIGIILSLGKYDPLFKLLYRLPGFSFFHNPFRFMYWSYFALAILGAEGLNRFAAAPASNYRHEIRRIMARLSGTVGASLIVCAGGALFFHFAKARIARFALSHVQKSMLSHAYKTQHIEYYSAKIERMIADIAAALNPLDHRYLIAIFLALAAIGFCAACLRRPRLHRPAYVVLSALALIGLTDFRGFLHADFSGAKIEPPPLARYYARQEGLFRIYNVQSQEDIIKSAFGGSDRLESDYNMLFNIPQAGEYSALGSFRYYNLLGSLGSVNLAFGVLPVTENAVRAGLPLLSLCNVRYITSTAPLAVPGLTWQPFDSFFLYKNESVLPRAFVVPEAAVIPDPSVLLDSMHSPGFDPWAAVYLESAPQVHLPNGFRSTATVVSCGDQRVSLDADGPGWLVVTDLFYPGWKSRIDGNATPIYRGDYVFRSVPLPEGRHHVEFYLDSRSFKAGAFISVVSVLLLLGMYCLGLMLRRAD